MIALKRGETIIYVSVYDVTNAIYPAGDEGNPIIFVRGFKEGFQQASEEDVNGSANR